MKVNYRQTWIEAAPAPFIAHQKPSISPKLETIVEERLEHSQVLAKIIFLLPVLLSFFLYFSLYKQL